MCPLVGIRHADCKNQSKKTAKAVNEMLNRMRLGILEKLIHEFGLSLGMALVN